MEIDYGLRIGAGIGAAGWHSLNSLGSLYSLVSLFLETKKPSGTDGASARRQRQEAKNPEDHTIHRAIEGREKLGSWALTAPGGLRSFLSYSSVQAYSSAYRLSLSHRSSPRPYQVRLFDSVGEWFFPRPGIQTIHDIR